MRASGLAAVAARAGPTPIKLRVAVVEALAPLPLSTAVRQVRGRPLIGVGSNFEIKTVLRCWLESVHFVLSARYGLVYWPVMPTISEHQETAA
jgi:hypothetical protein